MDARELTTVVEDLRGKVREQSKQIEYMDQELQKLRLLMNDLRIDVEMLRRERTKR